MTFFLILYRVYIDTITVFIIGDALAVEKNHAK